MYIYIHIFFIDSQSSPNALGLGGWDFAVISRCLHALGLNLRVSRDASLELCY